MSNKIYSVYPVYAIAFKFCEAITKLEIKANYQAPILTN